MLECQHKESSVQMGKLSFPAGTHMCLIYSDESERRNIIGRFIKNGLRFGEKVYYSSDTMSPDDMLDWFRNMWGAAREGVISDQLSIQEALKQFCPSGEFVPDVIFDHLRTNYQSARKSNYPGMRFSGEMSWALQGVPGSNRLMEYEANLNKVFMQYPITGICQYNENIFNRATIQNILKVHPVMIVGGQIIENPYYMNPDDFLSEWKTKSFK